MQQGDGLSGWSALPLLSFCSPLQRLVQFPVGGDLFPYLQRSSRWRDDTPPARPLRRSLLRGKGPACGWIRPRALSGLFPFQSPLQCAHQEIMHQSRIPEPHFVLGGMNVHIHLLRGHLQEQNERGVPSGIETLLVGLSNGMVDQPITDDTTVEIEILQIGLAASEIRRGQPPPQPQSRRREIGVERMMHEGLATEPPQAALPVLGRCSLWQPVELSLPTTQRESHVETAQSDSFEHLLQMAQLGTLATQETAAYRRVEKEVPHLHRRPGWMGPGLNRTSLLTAGHLHGPAALIPGTPRYQPAAGNRGDAGQCLAAEPHADQMFQIGQSFDLAGGMAAQCEHQIVPMNSAAVVLNPNQAAPSPLDLDPDPGGTGIQAVLQQLLEHRSGPLHHLSRRDLVGQLGREGMHSTGSIHGDPGRRRFGKYTMPAHGARRRNRSGRPNKGGDAGSYGEIPGIRTEPLFLRWGRDRCWINRRGCPESAARRPHAADRSPARCCAEARRYRFGNVGQWWRWCPPS